MEAKTHKDGLGWTDLIAQLVYVSLNMIFYVTDILMFKCHVHETHGFSNLTVDIGRKYTEKGLADEDKYATFTASLMRKLRGLQVVQSIGTILNCVLTFHFAISALDHHGLLTTGLIAKMAILCILEIPLLLFVLMPAASLGFDAGLCRSAEFMAMAFEQWTSRFNFETKQCQVHTRKKIEIHWNNKVEPEPITVLDEKKQEHSQLEGRILGKCSLSLIFIIFYKKF